MRGYQKKVIHLKETNSALFDEAYFIVRKEAEISSLKESDMVVEANRIIEESLDFDESRMQREKIGKLRAFLTPFLLGAVASFLLSASVYFIIGLI